MLVSGLASGVGYFFICYAEEVIYAGIVEQGKLNNNIIRHIQHAAFIVAVCALVAVQQFGKMPLFQVVILTQISDAFKFMQFHTITHLEYILILSKGLTFTGISSIISGDGYYSCRNNIIKWRNNMKLRRIMSAMLAAALVTSTVAFAEDIATESELDINLTVENSKGTYTFTDEEFAAYIDYNVEVNGYGEGTTYTSDPGYIFNEDSIITIADGKSFNINQIYLIDFELIDIEKDADGNTSFNQISTEWLRLVMSKVEPIWGPDRWGSYGLEPTIEASWLIDNFDRLGHCIEYYEEWGVNYDADEINSYDYDDVDMLVINFYTNDEFNEYGNVVYPWDYDSETGEDVLRPNSNPHRYSAWLFTEQGAAMLNEANAGTSAPETPEAPASDYEVDVTEALTAEDIADVIAANADSDVIINGENGVSFKFAKGTMAAVDGIEAYDFTSAISTNLADVASDKLTEDNFVMSIDYAYSGKLPAKAEITIPVGVEYAGKTLYYSRILENGVKLIDSAEVDENGFITVTQDSCSDYILTTEDISADAAGNTEDVGTDDKQSPDTGVHGIAAIAGIAILAGAAITLSRKKK